MKEEITSLDLFFLAKELKERLVGGKVRGIKQSNRSFIFEIYKKERFFFKFVLGKAVYTTKFKEKTEKPSNFCMQLRKNLVGNTILNVSQAKFDRILEVETNNCKIILEIFGKGNIILTDLSGFIIAAHEKREWKDRKLFPGEKYKYPPSNLDPFGYNFFDFQEVLSKLNKEIVKVLAVDFGFGGTYAEEFCRKLGLDKEKMASSLNQLESDKLFRLFENLKSEKIRPTIFLENKKMVDFSPFDMQTYENYEKIRFESFEEAVETYFEGLGRLERAKKKRETIEKEVEKKKKIIEKQKNQLKKLQEKEEELKKKAKMLYENYQTFHKILGEMRKLKEKGLSWQKIKQKIRIFDEEKKVKEIIPQKARIVFVFNGFEIGLDFRKSVEENANSFFEEAKKLKKKAENLKKVMLGFEKCAEKEKVAEEKKEWYEKFRWFVSSDGFLVIAGKDAKTNEALIKKHGREHDLILHADIRGAPFVLIRNDKKIEIPMETVVEAGEFAVSHSKAWVSKIGSINVYYMKPSSLVKEPFLPTGSFRIRGEKKLLEKIAPRLSIGLKQEGGIMKIISGPVTAVKKQTPYIVTIVPGDKTSDELAKEIKKQFLLKVPFEIKETVDEISTEEIKRLIPYGRGEVLLF